MWGVGSPVLLETAKTFMQSLRRSRFREVCATQSILTTRRDGAQRESPVAVADPHIGEPQAQQIATANQ